AHSLRAEYIDRGGRFDMSDLDMRNLNGRRTKIIGKSPGQEIALIVVCQLFEQGRTQAVSEATVNLPFYDFGVELGYDIMNRSIFINRYGAGLGIDFDRGQVDHEAERDGGGNPIVVIGRPQDRRRYHGCLM